MSTSTSTTPKTTYKTALDAVIDGKPITTEIRDKLIALRTSIEKKSGAERKPNANQIANMALVDAIVEHLTETGGKETVSSLIKSVPAVAGMSNQKVSALCRQAHDAERLFKVVEKRVTYYTAVAPVDGGETEGEGA